MQKYQRQLNFFLLHLHIVFCYFSTNEKLDLLLSDNFMSGLEILKNWRVNKNIVAYEKLLAKLKVNIAMDWRNDQKVNFIVKLREKKSRFCKQLCRAFLLYNIRVYFRYQYTRSSTNTNYRYRCKSSRKSSRCY